jgi:hypothetical protein
LAKDKGVDVDTAALDKGKLWVLTQLNFALWAGHRYLISLVLILETETD